MRFGQILLRAGAQFGHIFFFSHVIIRYAYSDADMDSGAANSAISLFYTLQQYKSLSQLYIFPSLRNSAVDTFNRIKRLRIEQTSAYERFFISIFDLAKERAATHYYNTCSISRVRRVFMFVRRAPGRGMYA